MSPPSTLLNSLKLLNGTTQRCSGPSHLVQCLLFTFRMLVVPPSGSIRSNSLKSTDLPLACSFSARFFVASISTFEDDGIPHRAVASSRAVGSVAHDRGLVVRKHAGHWRQVSDVAAFLSVGGAPTEVNVGILLAMLRG